MNIAQKLISSSAVFLLLLTLVAPVTAGKPDKPDKPGGGKPPAPTLEPLEVVYVDKSVVMLIDGNMDEWDSIGCNFYPHQI